MGANKEEGESKKKTDISLDASSSSTSTDAAIQTRFVPQSHRYG